MRSLRTVNALLVILTGALCIGTNAAAESAADFYKGKTVSLLVGASAGGGYDSYARNAADHIGKYIPGHPNVIVQNMNGAGGAKAANYFANVAPRDGSMMLLTLAGVSFNQVLGAAKPKYDLSKFNWVGRLADEPGALVVLRSKAATLEDVKSKKILMAASGIASNSYYLPVILNALLGTKFKVIRGFKGIQNMFLAIEQGEVDGVVTSYDALIQRAPQLLKQKKVGILIVFNTERLASQPNVPTAEELMPDARSRAVMELAYLPQAFGRSIALPQDVPTERVKAMRTALAKTVRDPAYIAAARKRKNIINYASGEKVQEIVNKIVNAEPNVIATARKIIDDAKGE